MALDGNAKSPGQLVYMTGGETGGSTGAQLSLSDIAASFLGSIAQTAAQGVSNVVENKTRSQNTQPVPDLTAAAAMPQVSSFINGSVAGVSIPILLIGGAALLYLAVRR